jgi:hypothetical protein
MLLDFSVVGGVSMCVEKVEYFFFSQYFGFLVEYFEVVLVKIVVELVELENKRS